MTIKISKRLRFINAQTNKFSKDFEFNNSEVFPEAIILPFDRIMIRSHNSATLLISCEMNKMEIFVLF